MNARADRGDAIDRIRDVIARLAVGVFVGVARVRPGKIGIEQKPIVDDPMVIPFDAVALAGAVDLGAARVGRVQQFGTAVECPQRQ